MHGMQLPGLQETGLKHSPGRRFSTNKGPGNFPISLVKTYLLEKGNYSSPASSSLCLLRLVLKAKPRDALQGLGAGLYPQQGQLWAQRAKATAGPRPLPSPLVLPQHCPVLGQDVQETSPEPCSRTQELRENYVLSPPLDTGPCGLPQSAKF